MAKPAVDTSLWSEGSPPDSRSATPKSAAAPPITGDQDVSNHHSTWRRRHCGRRRISPRPRRLLRLRRRRRRRAEAPPTPPSSSSPSIPTRQRSATTPSATATASGCSSRASTTRCSSSTRTARSFPQLVTNFEYSEDKTQLTLDLDTSATFDDGTALSAELVKQNLDARGNPDLSAYSAFRRRAAERDHRRRRRRRRHRHPHVRRGEAGVRVQPRPARRRHRRADRRCRPLEPRRDARRLRPADGRRARRRSRATPTFSSRRRTTPPPPTTPSTPTSSSRSSTRRRASTRRSRARSISPTSPPTRRRRSSRPASASSPTAARSRTSSPSTRPAHSAPQWADPRVYQALSMAIDRETYVAAVHPGEIPTANALPADNPGYLPELEEEYAYDPEGAKDLLAEAGYPDGFDFDFTISQGSQRDLEALQPYWEAIGVNVNLKNAASTEELFAVVQTEPLGGPIPLTWTNPLGNVFGVLFGFANFHGAENAEIQAAAGAFGAAQGGRRGRAGHGARGPQPRDRRLGMAHPALRAARTVGVQHGEGRRADVPGRRDLPAPGVHPARILIRCRCRRSRTAGTGIQGSDDAHLRSEAGRLGDPDAAGRVVDRVRARAPLGLDAGRRRPRPVGHAGAGRRLQRVDRLVRPLDPAVLRLGRRRCCRATSASR